MSAKRNGSKAAEVNELVVVYGPAGSGKTRHAVALREAFKARMIFDEGEAGAIGPLTKVQGRVLILTHDLPTLVRSISARSTFGVRVYTIEEALRIAGMVPVSRASSLMSEMIVALKNMVAMARFLDLPNDPHVGSKCALTVASAEGVIEQWVNEKGGRS